MPVAHIDDDHRRRLLVERQLLGAPGRAGRRLADVARSLSLLHSTDPVTPYLSIHARSDEPVGAVDDAFTESLTLLRHTTIRRTVFSMPLDVVPLAHGAFNTALLATLRSNLDKWLVAAGGVDEPVPAFRERVETAVVERLRCEGPMTGASLADAIPELRVKVDPAPNAASAKPIRITSKVLEIVAADGRIARGRPTGRDYTSASWRWAPIDAWLGPSGIETIDPERALAGLIARYLASFGPATLTDLTWWTGIGKLRIRAALSQVDAVDVTLDGGSEVGFVLPDDDLAAPSTVDSVALLPGLDSTTMGWKQRSWYVDDRPSTGVFDRNGNAGPTVWLDGRVVGVWTQRADGSIAVEVFDEIGTAASAALDIEVSRVADWLGDVRVKWRYPTPITKRLMGD